MKNYQDKQNTPSTEFNSFDTIIAIIFVLFALSMATLHAQPLYECDITSTGSCIVYMDTVLEESASVDDALALCEYYDGTYDSDQDTCTINEGVHNE